MKKIFTLFLAFFLSFLVYAQEFTSSAYHKNFSFKEYKAHPQNWAVTQDKRGIMYFGNTSGVLEYDGVNWRLLNNSFPTRDIIVDNKGQIYVCGAGGFGYLSPNKIGEMKYISLSSRLNLKSPPDVWTILEKNNEIYFQTRQKGIFKFSPYENKDSIFDASKKNIDKIKIIGKNKNFRKIYKVDNKIIASTTDKKFYFIENDTLVKTPYHDFFKNFIFGIDKFDTNKLLFTKNRKLIIYDEITNKISDFKTEADAFIRKNRIYTGKKINQEDKFSAGTANGGVAIINKYGKIIDVFNNENILADNTCYGQFHKNGVSWYALNIGISKIETGSAFRFLNKKNNVESPVLSIAKHNKILYLSSFAGISYIELDKIKDKTKNIKFKKIPNTTQATWKFEKFFINKNKEILIAAKTNGLFIIEKDKLKKISDKYCYGILKSLKDTSKLFIGTQNSIEILEYKNSKFIMKKIADLKGNIISIAEDKNENIWIGTYFNGIYRLKHKQNYENLDIAEQYEILHYDTTNGLPSNNSNLTYFINDEIIFTTEKGILKFDDKKERFYHTDDYGKCFGEKIKKELSTLFIRKNGDIIADGRTILKKQKNNSYIADTTFAMRLPEMLLSSFLEMSDSIVLFGSVDGLFIYNSKKKLEKQKSYNTLIREVKCGEDSILFFGTNYNVYNDSILTITLKQKNHLIPIVNYKDNSLVFHYSAQFYKAQNKIKYSHKLEGFENSWSNWTNETKKEYTNLYEGKYVFQVKSKNVYGDESTIARYEFEILPPWQRTNLAYLSYIVLGFIFIFMIVKLYTKRLKEQNVKLENTVQERTKEIRKQNEQIMGKNVELEQQKEEILTQAEELQEVNVELEKLSIVASETDNAVLIFDENFDLQWVNYGFMKIYGYSFEEFTKDKKINLIKNSGNLEIKSLINNCINKKKSVIYETKNITKSKDEIWLQTTLTPIFDEENNLLKLIAIETDISEIKDAHNKISLQNEMITSSITYAQTIQKAILPIDLEMKKHFDFFNIFRPKDIVSGDFYWFTKLKIENKFFIFVAVVDCTGHGVPGAFMSMIGSRLLSEIVKERKIIDTAKILELLDDGIKKSLKQAQTENNDGMDLCLCRFEKMENENINVNFSGAKRPLFIYRDENNEIETIKPDRRSIGGKTKKRRTVDFTNQEFFIKNEDIIYLTTDGYIDQNNLERKRFGTKKFLEITKKIARKNLQKQKEILEKELNNWMKIEKQRDDITVMGIKNIRLM